MKVGIYAYKDNVNGFLQPHFEVYDAAALRGFSYACSQSGLMNFRPEDYSLWHIGIFDSETGVIEPLDPKLIAHGNEVIKDEK